LCCFVAILVVDASHSHTEPPSKEQTGRLVVAGAHPENFWERKINFGKFIKNKKKIIFDFLYF
jgi:hypothetical protein